MKHIKIWDNRKTWDRYTVLIGTSYYGMSENATSPSGFNQYIGELGELNQRSLGYKVPHELLSMELRKAINDRARTYYQERVIRVHKHKKAQQYTESKLFYIAVAIILIVMYHLNTLR